MAPVCGLCNSQPSKYKCPKCQIPYCSLACYKPHKENHPEASGLPAPTPATSIPEEKNKVPSHPTNTDAKESAPPPLHRLSKTPNVDFSSLATHPEFLALLRRYPNLKNELRKVYIETLPPPPPHLQPTRGGWNSRGRGGFRPNRPQNWNPETGIKRASARVARSRSIQGEDAEAMREFEDLIVKLYGHSKDVEMTSD